MPQREFQEERDFSREAIGKARRTRSDGPCFLDSQHRLLANGREGGALLSPGREAHHLAKGSAMAPRPSWNGYLKISLVSVPVTAYVGSQTGPAIRFHQLHKECHSRIRYVKTCPIHGEVSQDEIVLGYEAAKDQYVVVEPDERRSCAIRVSVPSPSTRSSGRRPSIRPSSRAARIIWSRTVRSAKSPTS
jgi:hypothetical protein